MWPGWRDALSGAVQPGCTVEFGIAVSSFLLFRRRRDWDLLDLACGRCQRRSKAGPAQAIAPGDREFFLALLPKDARGPGRCDRAVTATPLRGRRGICSETHSQELRGVLRVGEDPPRLSVGRPNSSLVARLQASDGVAWRDSARIVCQRHFSTFVLARRLAISPADRARLMLPTGVPSGDAFRVTSKYTASPEAPENPDLGSSVRRPIV